MSRSRTTSGKRQREQQKLEKAKAKVQRRADRQAMGADPTEEPVESDEAQLIEELATLHRTFESDGIDHQDFEDRREKIRRQLEQIDRQR